MTETFGEYPANKQEAMIRIIQLLTQISESLERIANVMETSI